MNRNSGDLNISYFKIQIYPILSKQLDTLTGSVPELSPALDPSRMVRAKEDVTRYNGPSLDTFSPRRNAMDLPPNDRWKGPVNLVARDGMQLVSTVLNFPLISTLCEKTRIL
mmetsp:Transcript_16161/g.33197  ORF Transcript_16161/g.33197 Transcript_16161/m.33197 type:complete len:112 (+) Transcript_16161:946-1281(+)